MIVQLISYLLIIFSTGEDFLKRNLGGIERFYGNFLLIRFGK
jgi:hypothetical protein